MIQNNKKDKKIKIETLQMKYAINLDPKCLIAELEEGEKNSGSQKIRQKK